MSHDPRMMSPNFGSCSPGWVHMSVVLLPAAVKKSVFLTRALEKILSERETKRSQHAALKKACEAALSESTSTAHRRSKPELVTCVLN